MINITSAYAFCAEDISKIENYDKAIADQTLTWACHHRRGTIYRAEDLQAIGEYFHRPAIELIFLKPADHTRLHMTGNQHTKGMHFSAEVRQKVSNALKGRHLSEEHKQKLRLAKLGSRHPNYGKHLSENTRQKISQRLAGKPNCKLRGRSLSDETKQKISDAKKGNTNVRGYIWWNNGIKNVRAKECPEGFVKGRLRRKHI